MSNYNCPQCGEPILDTPGGPNEKHICTKYIPYSKRNNITDPDLGGLLDYLERVMGWEIFIRESTSSIRIVEDKNLSFYIDIWGPSNEKKVHLKDIQNDKNIFEGMYGEVFFRSYKTLLPVIRDIYS